MSHPEATRQQGISWAFQTRDSSLRLRASLRMTNASLYPNLVSLCPLSSCHFVIVSRISLPAQIHLPYALIECPPSPQRFSQPGRGGAGAAGALEEREPGERAA